MLIKTGYFSIILLAFTSLIQSLYAQSYNIQSFEGDAVTVSFKSFEGGRVLAISCSTDTLFFSDYTGKVYVHVLNNKFLEVVFGVRGGSGLTLKDVAVLLISKGKIRPALIFTAYAHSISQENEGTTWVNLKLTGNEKQGYKAVAAIRDEERSFKNSKENHMHSVQVALRFDTLRKVFYSTNAKMAKMISVCVPKNYNTTPTPLQVNETVPVIWLNKREVYYYIKGMWYNKGYKDVFYSEYYW